ncbi:MAG TPA: SUMF1/EgtB/PvdO family nonheme iron enzyme [Opitutales bacterium]|nr:SUMF1/EgtB/PvdO family nonheme iron enzyme [Opitutales bacterium]
MKKQFAILFASFAAALAAAADPAVSDVSFARDGSSRKIVVSYTLSGGSAIITMEVQTNVSTDVWAPVGDEYARHVYGAVNRKVESGPRTLTWIPDASWPIPSLAEGKARVVVNAWATNAPPDYMTVSLTAPSNILFYASAAALPLPVTNRCWKTDWLVMRRIHAAGVKWRMGSPAGESSRTPEAETNHYVTLSKDYYIGVYPVTQMQFWHILNWNNGWHDNGVGTQVKNAPTAQPRWLITYDELRGTGTGYGWPTNGHAVVSTGYLGKLRAHSGQEFDLPTEAQWEYACRAGSGSAYFYGSDSSGDLARYAWYASAISAPCEVGLKEPTPWGLYDILGNVWEWCLDWYQPFDANEVSDPAGPEDPRTYRIARGGSHISAVSQLRSAYRTVSFVSTRSATDTGFRVACPAELK